MTYYVSSGTLNPTHSLTHSSLRRNVYTQLGCCFRRWSTSLHSNLRRGHS